MSNIAPLENSQAQQKPASVTPMMQQYLDIKNNYSDCLLFYRMGDFYELFFEDAIKAAKVLDIALTKRGKHESQAIDMCGVPHHSYEPYLHKLIKAGFKVAICEQMESPEEAKKRGYKAVVRRDVVRIVTPGTLLEENLLNAKESNYLASIAMLGKKMALAWVDISTGEFYTSETNLKSLNSDLARLDVKELLIPQNIYDRLEIVDALASFRSILSPQASNVFEFLRAESKFKSFFNVISLNSFGKFARHNISAIGALLEYIELTQKDILPKISPPKIFKSENFMQIDASTRKNLELNYTLSGDKKGSLLSIIDKTITGVGARLLASFLAAPLTCPNMINHRYDMVEFFSKNEDALSGVTGFLSKVPEIERSLARICIGKGGPRDLLSIKNGLNEALNIKFFLQNFQLPHGVAEYISAIEEFESILPKLNEALKEEVNSFARDGNFIEEGYNSKLDELRNLRDNGKERLTSLRDTYRQETGINTLKVTHNNVLGYFIEVTPANNNKVTDDKFIHRQSLASAIRYTTVELRSLESEILNAKDSALQLELEIFDDLAKAIIANADNISRAASSIAGIDVMCSFAALAKDYNYNRPQIDEGSDFKIIAGRHPVVEASIAGEFVPNNANICAGQQLWLLTGPNMAGKSTFLRQNALIAILAQIGSFVPADNAHIGVVDKVFSRVGASDDLAKGHSTFMVEMVETATILNQATAKSLVILDEIGRGTATYDGLSIAWAVVEHLHNVNKSRTIFATHYHELTSLASSLSSLVCYSMKVKEWEGDVVFMHEVIEGAADRSYGIHVAKLAGLPKIVIKRANEVLNCLQKSEQAGGKFSLADDLPLFVSNNIPRDEPIKSKIKEHLEVINLDELSPRQALDILYDIKREALD